MRFLLAILLMAPSFAQQAAPQTKPEEKAPVAPEKAAPEKKEEKSESPAPSKEQWLTGSFDVGYRWVTRVRGSYPSYRSVVNLGEGPKLNGLDFTIQDPKKRLFDRLDARAEGWGGDPYNTAHLNARKQGIYDFSADYRNIAYFNALPSFANPFAPAGFNERAFDTRRRTANVDLELFPGKRITPYLVFERNSGYGHGVATWVQDANDEFAVPTLLRDSTNNYRGGLRLTSNRFHVTLEQGGTTFKDDNQASYSGANLGDRTTPIFGETLVLNNLRQAYGIRGSSIYSKVLVTASPFSRLDLYGQFLYSEPKTDARYFDLASGNFALLSSLLFYSGQYNLGSSSASQPHVAANLGLEVRPVRRLRIVESWFTNRYHETGFGALTEQILLSPAAAGPALASALNTRQVVNYNQYQVEAIFELTSRIAIRGGYRYVWGDATVRAGDLDPAGPLASRDLRRNVGLAGLTVRPFQKLSVNLDYEAASTDRDYFRTSLYDYHKVRARARYQATASLWFQANFALLDNQNPTSGIEYDFRSRDNSLAVYWTPNSGKRVSVMAEYDRSTLRSNINFLLLPFLSPAVSAYRENAHTATSTIDLALPAIARITPKLSLGGSLFVSAGTRSSRYYQPLGRLSLPLQKHVSWNTEWRWYGFGEQLYLYEGFRAHIFMTGIKVTR